MIKTNIYATIGPASYQKETIISMIENGLDGLRINLSHGDLNTYKDWIKNIKKAEKDTGKAISIIADVQGPEIRAQLIKKDALLLNEDEEIYIVFDKNIELSDTKTDKKILINYPQIAKQLENKQIILIDDGQIKLELISQDNYQTNHLEKSLIKCKVIQGGKLGNKKGVNFPGLKLDIPSLNDKDKEDIKQGVKLGVNFIMLPFTRNLKDVLSLRTYLDSLEAKDIGILAKIENQEGIDNLNSFLDKIDGVVIARGDLGVEIGLAKVPVTQKDIIKLCNQYKKPSIVVTHMLESMIESPLPTRAEISDIANAVLDKCSGVMLTGETAIGKYPVKSIEFMRKTIEETESWQVF
ncbi:MAG: pyruvate kinase [Halanaerobiales bacterium]